MRKPWGARQDRLTKHGHRVLHSIPVGLQRLERLDGVSNVQDAMAQPELASLAMDAVVLGDEKVHSVSHDTGKQRVVHDIV